MKCIFCADTGWVCENHPRRPWEGPHGCDCGGGSSRRATSWEYSPRTAFASGATSRNSFKHKQLACIAGAGIAEVSEQCAAFAALNA
jgi:hypothetical protein